MELIINPDIVYLSGMPKNGKSTIAVNICKNSNYTPFHLDRVCMDHFNEDIIKSNECIWTYYNSSLFNKVKFLEKIELELLELVKCNPMSTVIIEGFFLIDLFNDIHKIVSSIFKYSRFLVIYCNKEECGLCLYHNNIKILTQDYDDFNYLKLIEYIDKYFYNNPLSLVTYQTFSNLGAIKFNSDSELKYKSSTICNYDLTNKVCVDLCGNTGYHTFRMSETSKCSILVDNNISALLLANDINKYHYKKDNVEFILDDAINFLKSSKNIDIIFCASSFHYFGDKQQLLIDSCYDSLTDGGMMFIEIELDGSTNLPIKNKLKRPDGSILEYPTKQYALNMLNKFNIISIEKSSFQPGSIYDRFFFVVRK